MINYKYKAEWLKLRNSAYKTIQVAQPINNARIYCVLVSLWLKNI